MNEDPKESDPKYAVIFESVKAELDKTFNNVVRHLGFCHLYWGEKKAILWKKYGVDWESPAELNPDILFD